MSETTTGGGNAAVRPSGEPCAPAEWLRADQMAAIERRHQRYPVPPGVAPYPLCDDDGQAWPCDAAALLAHAGRWQALVGELLAAFRAAEGEGQMNSVVARWQGHAAATGLDALGPASGRALAALNEAQAALADAPPAPRGAAE